MSDGRLSPADRRGPNRKADNWGAGYSGIEAKDMLFE